jgi:HEAT repeat protein
MKVSVRERELLDFIADPRLARIGLKKKEVRKGLKDALECETTPQRTKHLVVQLARSHKIPELKDGLLAWIAEERSEVASMMAIEALVRLGEPSVIPVLVHIAQTGDHEDGKTEAAIRGLASLGQIEKLQEIAKRDPKRPETAFTLAKALETSDPDLAIDLYEQVCQAGDSGPDLRRAASLKRRHLLRNRKAAHVPDAVERGRKLRS